VVWLTGSFSTGNVYLTASGTAAGYGVLNFAVDDGALAQTTIYANTLETGKHTLHVTAVKDSLTYSAAVTVSVTKE
jgi:hypothetical protein